MKAIIIDDEKRARRILKTLIEEECPKILTVFDAENLLEGVAIIKAEQPDVVFLDIEMPNHSGLQILEFFKNDTINFQIIFTTAYGHYAIDAFKLSAVDYLLKPIDIDELKTAINKASDSLEENFIKEKLLNLERNFQQLALNKIALEVPKGIRFVSHEDILFFEADGVYTKVFLQNGKTELICKTLKHFTEQLSNKPLFYKPHRSYLINLKYMTEITKKDGLQVIMSNNKSIPIARDRKDEFMDIINRVF
ncbi:LytTR family DNA-binding domain-containing protein [Olleya sp. UBA1516]|uniref:LytR/AlgR family response regulator transcription factor n=1 Tax=Olleya sp. UBA1516 TaxID=1947013 RepID=UPI0025D441F7|nr:LytTR family DNA-binding domain-containing protein [Olleya sp. UBA1516]|tara:strand:+ start:6321 stop:7073 length:753 start_codon:yes stop_codon:yes gene_type:complete